MLGAKGYKMEDAASHNQKIIKQFSQMKEENIIPYPSSDHIMKPVIFMGIGTCADTSATICSAMIPVSET